MVCISTFNPNRLKPEQLALQLQNCIDDDINIQCYNKINQDITKIQHWKKYNKMIMKFDKKSQYVSGNSYLPMTSDWKLGGTAIVSFGNCFKSPSKTANKTAYYQQELILSNLNQSGPPWKFFEKDSIMETNKLKKKYGSLLQTWIFGDWNKDSHN